MKPLSTACLAVQPWHRGKLDEHGRFAGQGVLVAPRQKYEGSFRKGKYHGKGVLTDTDDVLYKGSFAHGLEHGRGVRYIPQRSVYDGAWKKGKRNGQGILSLPDGKAVKVMYVKGVWVGKFHIQSHRKPRAR